MLKDSNGLFLIPCACKPDVNMSKLGATMSYRVAENVFFTIGETKPKNEDNPIFSSGM